MTLRPCSQRFSNSIRRTCTNSWMIFPCQISQWQFRTWARSARALSGEEPRQHEVRSISAEVLAEELEGSSPLAPIQPSATLKVPLNWAASWTWIAKAKLAWAFPIQIWIMNIQITASSRWSWEATTRASNRSPRKFSRIFRINRRETGRSRSMPMKLLESTAHLMRKMIGAPEGRTRCRWVIRTKQNRVRFRREQITSICNSKNRTIVHKLRYLKRYNKSNWTSGSWAFKRKGSRPLQIMGGIRRISWATMRK